MLRALFLLAIIVSASFSASAADLYKVMVSSPDEAAVLSGMTAEGVVRLDDGYLVLAHGEAGISLLSSGLSFELIAADVDRSQLALDNRLDRANIERYPLLFEQGNFRLYRVNLERLLSEGESPELSRLTTLPIRIEYIDSKPFDKGGTRLAMGLDSLINMVSQDTLQQYVETLQAFPGRYYGTSGNHQSADWIESRLLSYGYDSVFQDSFVFNAQQCMNVVAVKPGSVYPELQIILGAHRDAVSGSPGADDNGSGTAAVMEIARILKNVDTKCTFIFALFDAEELGLIGSEHYAANAATNGDSIVYMLNMDMIAHYQNSNQAKVYHGTEVGYSQLWIDLADSLVGITGFLQGNTSGSDHYPFSQFGWTVSFAHEYIFSTVYHSYQDSTTYINYDYMTRMAQVSLATAYTVNETVIPIPSLVFSYPNGLPQSIQSNVSTTFQLQVDGSFGGQPVPNSGQLYYSIDGGAYTAEAMSVIGLDLYEASLPALTCDQSLSFYVSADEVTEGTYYDPDTTQPFSAPVATSMTVSFEDNFQTNQGWTVSGNATDGQWERGIPAGGGTRGDPSTDFDGSGYCYLTDNVAGNSDVDGGTTTLTSPTFDAAGGEALIHYARWFSNHVGAEPFSDVMNVYISDDNGSSWTLIETVGPVDQASGGWYEHSYWVADPVTPTDLMKLRFDASDTGGGSVVEAAVDAVKVTVFQCDDQTLQIITTGVPDWTAGQLYSFQMEYSGGTEPYTWSDRFNDLAGTGLALLVTGSLEGTPLADGQISFTALVTDGALNTDEAVFTFSINPAVSITTALLPNGGVGSLYEEQLAASGGGGPKTWIDVNTDLNGTGLALSPDGLLSGTPLTADSISFIARAEDSTGGFDERLFAFDVAADFVCGDADGSGGVDVSDLTYLVDYLFGGGTPPPNLQAADCDGSGGIDVSDVSCFVEYLFGEGIEPQC